MDKPSKTACEAAADFLAAADDERLSDADLLRYTSAFLQCPDRQSVIDFLRSLHEEVGC